jgi:hypothetical protein
LEESIEGICLKMYVYLAGAMEHAPDLGAAWRKDISQFLIDELGHQVFNPCIEQNYVLTEEEQRYFRTWKTNDLSRFRATVHKIIQKDLNTILTKTDYIICLWDEFVLNGGGTQGELTMAHFHNIPVYMVSKIPTPQISSWILGCTTELLPDFEALKQFLRQKFVEK